MVSQPTQLSHTISFWAQNGPVTRYHFKQGLQWFPNPKWGRELDGAGRGASPGGGSVADGNSLKTLIVSVWLNCLLSAPCWQRYQRSQERWPKAMHLTHQY